MASSSHAWEQEPHPWDRDSDSENDHHGWDQSDNEDDSINWDSLSPEEAGDELASRLLTLQNRGALSAKAVCSLAFFAKRAGAVGFVSKLSHNPEAASGHFQRHLDSVLFFTDEKKKLYDLPCPGHTRYDKERVTHIISTIPFQEELANELAENPELGPTLDKMVQNNELPADYYQHPVVRANPGERVYPVSMYLDGVAHSKVDNVLGITISNLVSGTRHLCIALRKSLLCRCGCRGWCTLRPIWVFVHWCLVSMSQGVFPTSRHDSSAWLPTDELRESLQGFTLGLKCALIQIKADWGEFGKSLGLTQWNHKLRPCPFCDVTHEELISCIPDWSIAEDAATITTPEAYEASCKECEIKITLSQVDHAEVLSCLEYSKRATIGFGRCIMRDIPRLGLQRFDRLEATSVLPDVGMFEAIREWPFQALFWRQKPHAMVIHRLPLFDPAIGVTIMTIVIDALHTMNLGVYQLWCLFCIWALIKANAWNVSAHFTAKEVRVLSCEQVRTELTAYYRQLRIDTPGLDVTEIPHFSLRTIGGETGKVLRTKGAETKFLIGYVLQALQKRGHKVDSCATLIEAGRCLQEFDTLIGRLPRRVGVAEVQTMLILLKRFVALANSAFLPLTPKVHLWLHMILRTHADVINHTQYYGFDRGRTT